uniref:Glycolipid transfer protein domain-containing protein n=1 Tax=Salmo trutta TaxID=8032 RepID=A0A674E2H5_SALTR
MTTKPKIRHCFSIRIWLRYEMGESIVITILKIQHSSGCLFEWVNKATSSQGLVDFQQTTDSGCRTLLWLHRALLWLQGFLEKISAHPGPPPFIAMPEQGFFYSLVCVMNQEMATRMGLNRVVRAIGEVYDRTQGALEEHGMLDLP